MATRYIARVHTHMVVGAQCESCGQFFDTQKRIDISSSAYSSQMAQQMAFNSLLKTIEKRKKNQDFGYQRCPNCGYFQSWMDYSIKARIGRIVRWIAYPLVWLVAVSPFVGVFAVVDPMSTGINASWQFAFILLLAGLLLVPVIPAAAAYYFLKRSYANAPTQVAAQVYSPKVGIGANPANAHSELGAAYFKEGNAAQALAHFNRAIQLDSHLAGAYSGRGLALASQGNPQAGLADLKRYLSLAGTNANPQIAGLVKQMEGQPAGPGGQS